MSASRPDGRSRSVSCPRTWLVLLALGLGWAVGASAQTEGSTAVRAMDACRARPMIAVAEALGVNLVINRFDAWAMQEEWARTDFESWSRNLQLGWEWDENALHTNMFMHPYHGALYFDGARANCLDYWQSVPIAFLGSWTWEYFGETWRPSLNDFFMTSFGGAALGEVLHRVSGRVLDEEARGRERITREVAALLIDPMRGLNRLLRGQWTRRGANPTQAEPAMYHVQTHLGARRARVTGPDARAVYSPTLLVAVDFGDPFEQGYVAPFDVLSLRAQVSPDGGGLNVLSATGRLYSTELTSRGARHRHQLVVSQRYDYVNNPVQQFGEQSIQLGLVSRWTLGMGGYRIRSNLTADALPLGAIDAPHAGFGERTYDFGPGMGAVVELALERDGVTYVSFYNRIRYLHSVSGAAADHSVLLSGLTLNVPISHGLGVGAYLSGTERHSRYASDPDDERSYLETRIYLTWTSAASAQDGAR